VPGVEQDGEPLPQTGRGGDKRHTLLRAVRPRAGAYFAIGELTHEDERDLRSKSLAEVLERKRRERG
jgi:hypothetical protein